MEEEWWTHTKHYEQQLDDIVTHKSQHLEILWDETRAKEGKSKGDIRRSKISQWRKEMEDGQKLKKNGECIRSTVGSNWMI